MANANSEANERFFELILPSERLAAPTPDLEALRDQFHIHPLTMDDFLHRNQRAKFETFDRYAFLVWHLATRHKRGMTELHFVIAGERLALVATALPDTAPTWKEFFFEKSEPQNAKTSLALIFRKLVRSSEEHLAEIVSDVAAIERRILDRHSSPQEILSLKRDMREFGARMIAGRDALSDAADFLQFSGEERLLFRRSMDRFQRLLSNHDLLTTQVGSLFDVYWGSAGAETNAQLKRLTVMTTLFLPIVVWSGFFGMNFSFLPFGESWFFGFGMFCMGASFAGVLVYLRRQGLLGRRRKTNGDARRARAIVSRPNP